jgi:hypothetical protein
MGTAGLVAGPAAADDRYIPCEAIAHDARAAAIGRDQGIPLRESMADLERVLQEGPVKEMMRHTVREVYANPDMAPSAVYFRVLQVCGAAKLESNGIGR